MDNEAKLRPLYLAKILYERTDEDHYLTTAQLMKILKEEYGINSHRLLVRGHRCEYVETNSVRVTADAVQIDPAIVAPIVAIPILVILLIWLLVYYRKR